MGHSEEAKLTRSAKVTKYPNSKTYTPTVIEKHMEECGFAPEDLKQRIKAQKTFTTWLKHQDPSKLKLMNKLETFLQLLEIPAIDALQKTIVTGESIDDQERKMLSLYSRTMTDLYKLIHGEKKLNVNLGFDDIRKQMFENGKKEAKEVQPVQET